PNPSAFGSTVTFTAIVAPATTGTPTGNVVFTVDGTPQAPVALTDVAGQQEATFVTSALAAGSHAVTAAYSGDGSFTASVSDPATEVVTQATSTTTVTSSANPGPVGSSITFTAIVAPATTGTPTGNVVFTVDGTPQAPVALTDVGGQEEATFTTSSLALGDHSVTAAYGGDSNFSSSASTTLTQVTLTNTQAGAPTLAPPSQTGQGSAQGYTSDNGSAASPLVFDIPSPVDALFYRLYDVTNPSSPVLLAGPVQLTNGEITVNNHTLAEGTYQVAYTTAGSAIGAESAASQSSPLIVQTSLTASVNPAGDYVTVLPNNQVIVTFNHWLVGLTADQSDGSGFASAPFAAMLTPSGPDGKTTQALTGSLWSAPSGVDSGDLPVPATLVYHQNVDGTSTITLTADQPLSADVYLITVSAALADLAGNTLTSQGGALGTFYSSFTLAPTPANATPLAVTSVTANNGAVVINNNLIPRPDTIAVGFNKPLDLWTANASTVQLWQ
ncbi:MAG: Ig-like domain-containing protein, partial [Mycobacterium sp.]|nr:Ig-like domain-containing protein [Mycobacterium sp.]